MKNGYYKNKSISKSFSSFYGNYTFHHFLRLGQSLFCFPCAKDVDSTHTKLSEDVLDIPWKSMYVQFTPCIQVVLSKYVKQERKKMFTCIVKYEWAFFPNQNLEKLVTTAFKFRSWITSHIVVSLSFFVLLKVREFFLYI